MASKPGRFTNWPWERLGSFKYALYLPLVANAIQTSVFKAVAVEENFSLHVLVLAALRYLQGQLWMTVTRLHDIVDKHRVQDRSIKFEQLDREENWEDFILFQALVLYAYHGLSMMQVHPLFSSSGFAVTVFWHIGPVEFVYYWFHRLLHHHYLFSKYHSHHHSSFQTQAVTGNVHPFAEHFAYAWLFGSTFIVNSLLGTSSIALVYAYTLWFDFMNFIGHCNWEFIPTWLFKWFPPLKYLLYTPSFHSLHHTQVHTNFCLFMPLYDYLYQTVDQSSDTLHLAARQGKSRQLDFVYLTHSTDILSIFHFSIGIPSLACRPYERRWFVILLYPIAVPIMLALWLFGGSAIAVDEHGLDKLSMNVWALPRFNFHYNMSSQWPGINKLIQKSILQAQQKGAKVICLGMRNKDMVLNASGGSLVKDESNSGTLKIRIVDGSTLTTAVVLSKVPKDVTEVFMTGSESSKIGRAIAVYLCTYRECSVKLLSRSEASFEDVKRAIQEHQRHKLLRATSFEEGRQCKAWIVGDELLSSQQGLAPAGTLFYQFAAPMKELRSDCCYAKLPAMQLPLGVKGLRACEGNLPRGVVHASHAGGILHALEGWNNHEVGNSIQVEQIDPTFQAALENGFVPFY